MAKHTQQAKILSLLVAACGGWVSAVELSKISLQYSARVKELRKQGFQIKNRVEVVGRTKHGYFRLISEPVLGSEPLFAGARLFPQQARHRDDG